MSLTIENSELSSAPIAFPGVTENDNVWNSTATPLVPFLNNVGEFDVNKFIYYTFGFTQEGSGTSIWINDDYNYGMKGEKRDGIGSFYFLPPSFSRQTKSNEWTVRDLPDQLECKPQIQFWSWLSTAMNFLIPEHRAMVEWVWSAFQDVGCEYSNKANRFLQSMNPQASIVNPHENYYDIPIGVLDAYPIYLDPEYQNYTLTALKTLLYPEGEFSDLFVTEENYKILRDVCVGGYAVIEDKYYPVIARKSTIEDEGSAAYTVIKGQDEGVPVSSIRLTADDPMEDISNYKIGFFSASGPNDTFTIEWTDGPEKILRVTIFSLPPNGFTSQISTNDLIDAINAPHVDKWCTASNVSTSAVETPPFWNDIWSGFNWATDYRVASDVLYENITEYSAATEASEDWIPAEGKRWVYYDGFDSSDPKTPNVTGNYVDDRSRFRHLIRIEGDISDLNNLNPEFYITTGRKFQVDSYVIDLPVLTPNITTDAKFYTKNKDYTFYNNFVEFYENPREIITEVEILYCPRTDVIEYFLFELYGKLCNLDWEQYNYDNETGKIAVNVIMKTLQNLSTMYDFDQSSNVYGGLPMAPFDCRVIGTYCSYDYEVIAVDPGSLTITLSIPVGQKLHFFFIEGAYILVNDKFEVIIDSVDYDNAVLELESVDNIAVGDTINVKLQNNFDLNRITSPAAPLVGVFEHAIIIPAPLGYVDMLKCYSDIFESVTEERPEIVIWNEEGVNGIYHIMDTQIYTDGSGDSFLAIEYYHAEEQGIGYDARYNDIAKDVEAETAKVHFEWATHKFVLLYDPVLKHTYRAYLDTPMDTILDSNDELKEGDVICRNINIFDKKNFPGFTEFNKFMGINSVNNHNKMLMVSGMPVKHGTYFPGKEIEE